MNAQALTAWCGDGVPDSARCLRTAAQRAHAQSDRRNAAAASFAGRMCHARFLKVQQRKLPDEQAAIAVPCAANDDVCVSTVAKHYDHYLLYRRELVDYATMLIHDRASAEDVVQDAFVRFRVSMDGDEAITDRRQYLRRIVRNLTLDWRRRLSIVRTHFDSEYPADTIAEQLPNPEQALAARQELRLVLAAIAELPQRTRIALELHRFEGWKLKDIASRLDISVTLTHSFIQDGLDACRRRLKEAER